MINDIKLDGLNPGINPKKSDISPREAASTAKNADITISNHLNKMVNMLVSHEELPDETARVMQMKQQIEKNDYHVDFDALSEKLVHHLFTKANGI